MKLTGIKNPKVETFDNIKAYGKLLDIMPDSILIMKPDSFFSQFSRVANEVKLFDRQGSLIIEDSLSGKKGCSGNILRFISAVPPITYANKDSINSVEKSLSSIQSINSSSLNLQIEDDVDYYVLFYWNLFTGDKRNINYLNDLRSYISKNQHSKFQLIPVNCDMYEGVDWDQKFEEYKNRVRAARQSNG